MKTKRILAMTIIAIVISSVFNFGGELIQNPIDYVVSKGYMTLDKNNKFNNKSYVTREELATILYRVDKDKVNWDNVIESAMNSSVYILCEEKNSFGVFLTENKVLTTRHGINIESNNPITVMIGLNIVSAKLISYSNEYDLCILELSETFENVKPVKIAKSIKVGDEVITIGSPLCNPYSLSRGVISNLSFTNPITKQNFIQFDMTVNGGNSGGGVFNSDGELVTIIQSKIHEDYGYGLSFGANRNNLVEFLEKNNIERK